MNKYTHAHARIHIKGIWTHNNDKKTQTDIKNRMWSPVLLMQNYGFLLVEEYDEVERIEPEHMMMVIEMMMLEVVVLME